MSRNLNSFTTSRSLLRKFVDKNQCTNVLCSNTYVVEGNANINTTVLVAQKTEASLFDKFAQHILNNYNR